MISLGKSSCARQNLGVVNDFIQRLHPTGGNVGFHFLNEMVKATSRTISFNLLVPFTPEYVVKAMKQIPFLFRWKLLDR